MRSHIFFYNSMRKSPRALLHSYRLLHCSWGCYISLCSYADRIRSSSCRYSCCYMVVRPMFVSTIWLSSGRVCHQSCGQCGVNELLGRHVSQWMYFQWDCFKRIRLIGQRDKPLCIILIIGMFVMCLDGRLNKLYPVLELGIIAFSHRRFH